MSTFLVHYYVSGEMQVDAEDKDEATRMIKKAWREAQTMGTEVQVHARALDDIPVFVVRGES